MGGGDDFGGNQLLDAHASDYFLPIAGFARLGLYVLLLFVKGRPRFCCTINSVLLSCQQNSVVNTTKVYQQ